MVVMVYVLNSLFYKWSGSRKVNFKSITCRWSEGEVVAMTGLGASSTVIKMQTSHILI